MRACKVFTVNGLRRSFRAIVNKLAATVLVIPALSATTLQAVVAGEPAGTAPPSESIREWKATPIAAPATSSAPTPAVGAPVPKTPITISLTSTLRNGTLVVVLDDAPIFSERFKKPLSLISQTTTWDPLQVAAGPHRPTAKVLGTKETYFSKTYDLHVSSTKGSGLRFVMQAGKLIVEVAS